jgi:hypothetical protein
MKTHEMEHALWLHWAQKDQKVMCLNVSWGMFNHECDMLVLNKDNTFTEVEIKISKADLKKDLKKSHKHQDRQNRIHKLYFAIPECLETEEVFGLIPERAGIMVVYGQLPRTHITIRRQAQPQLCQGKPYKATEKEIRKLGYLMQFRYWRERIRANNLQQKIKDKSQLKLKL